MVEEVEQTQLEQQSNTGKWILFFLAIVFVAASVYGYVTTQKHVDQLTTDLSESRAQVAELQKRMQSAEAQEETLGQKLGMTKKELSQRAAALQAEQRAAESRLESEQKASQQQIGQVSGEVAGVKTAPSTLTRRLDGSKQARRVTSRVVPSENVASTRSPARSTG